MINIDVLSLSIYILSILGTLFFLIFWKLNQEIKGVAVWFFSVLAQTLGVVLYLSVGDSYEFVKTLSINFFLFLSILFIYVGARLFTEKQDNNKTLFAVFALLYSCSFYYVLPNLLYLSVVNFSFMTVVTLLSIHCILFAPNKYRTLGASLFSMLCGLIIVLSFSRLFDTLLLGSAIKYPLELVLILLISSGLTFCVFIICHEQKLIELLTLKQELKVEVERKNHHLVTLSHEVRTPLNAMVGVAQLMKAKLLDKELINDCNIIIESGQSLSSLATRTLDYSSFEAQEGSSLDISNVSISDLTYSILALLKPLAQEKGLLLHSNIAKQGDDLVELDKNKFRQILVNLLGNAIKYTDKGAVTLSLEVREILAEKIVIRVAVEDTGIGICASDQKALLQPFYQATKHTNAVGLSNEAGVGFGLSHTQYLVRLMASQLHFQSVEKKGSVFYFDLDLKKAPHNSDETDASSSAAATALNILVVEDIAVNQKIIERMLLLEGHHVAIAETGNQAILLLRDIKFDLIFLDMFLPDMHGLTLLSYINQDRRLKHKPKIIAVTAAATTEQISTYEQAGIMQVIKKPIMQEELKHAIDRIHLTDSIQTLRSQIVGDSLCAKSLFNIKTLTFLKENLSTKDFMQLVVEAPEIIDKYINNCKFEIENNNYAETVKVLHTLAGFSAQIGLEQLCQMARDLQTSKKANSQQDIKRLLKLAKSSLVVFKKESL